MTENKSNKSQISPSSKSSKPGVTPPDSVKKSTVAATSVKKKMSISKELIVVGVAASAGGLEALRLFVKQLPTTRVCYIIAQHMSPQHRSMMVELLARETKLPVHEARHGMGLVEGNIYVSPPNSDIFVRDEKLCLRKPLSEIGPKPSADYLFVSMAEALAERSVGVVMSGTGRDGSHGVMAINAAGGICIAQEPTSAKYDSMPIAAINAGVDYILSPMDMASQIEAITKNPRIKLELPQIQEAYQDNTLDDPFQKILRRIAQKTKLNFSEYKETTLTRQIERRMAVNHIDTLDAYLELIDRREEEVTTLSSSFMICVTSFFRDGAVFDELERKLAEILKTKKPGDDIRIWVPGCATGEEAYSIAILLNEYLGSNIDKYKVHIFATDINYQAIEFARKGVYPEASIDRVKRQHLRKYFYPMERFFQVQRKIRDMVLFAQHNLIQDPPFVKLDIISCRNLMIYFKPELQNRVIELFHYSLQKDGYLFLGKSETIGTNKNLFYENGGTAHLYKKRESQIKSTLRFANGGPFTSPRISAAPKEQVKSKSSVKIEVDQSRKILSDIYIPPSVHITSSGQILAIYGETSPFMSFREGMKDFSIFSAVADTIRTELKAIVQKVIRTNESLGSHPFTYRGSNENEEAKFVVRPLVLNEGSDPELIISFENYRKSVMASDQPLELSDSDVSTEKLKELEHELGLTKESLQTVIEELETSNEELQALNEEAQASNEELQASNEELQTANEELQATNEELTTVNDELTVRTYELANAVDDMKILEESQGLATLVLDKNFNIRRFNSRARYFFEIDDAKGELVNILRIAPNFNFDNLHEILKSSYKTHKESTYEFYFKNGFYELKVIPYEKTISDSVGAIIVIRDITNKVMSERKLAETHKIEAMGQLSGGLAHDFNNLINVVVGNLQLLISDVDEFSKESKELIEGALSAALKGSEVTQSLLSISGKKPAARRKTDIIELINKSQSLFKSSAHPFQLNFEFFPGPIDCNLDSQGLINSILNLIVNSRDSIREKNESKNQSITLSIRLVEHVHNLITEEFQLNAGVYVSVEISDTGKGMTAETKAKAFEPFYSTKGGKGNGIGLAMVRGFCIQNEGAINIVSEVDKGAVVSLYFPVLNHYQNDRLEALEKSKLLESKSSLEELNERMKEIVKSSRWQAGILVAPRISEFAFVAAYGIEDDEKWNAKIFSEVMLNLQDNKTKTNGYFIIRNNEISLQENSTLFRTLLGVPVFYNGFPVAVLCYLSTSEVLAPDESLIHILKALALSIADCISDNCNFSEIDNFYFSKLAQTTLEGDAIKVDVEKAKSIASETAIKKEIVEKQKKDNGIKKVHPPKILIVDDDVLVANLAVKLFLKLGIQCTKVCYGADEAMLELSKNKYDAVFTDYKMPGEYDGIALAKYISKNFPGTKVVLTSGFSDYFESESRDYKLITKPYLLSTLENEFGNFSKK